MRPRYFLSSACYLLAFATACSTGTKVVTTTGSVAGSIAKTAFVTVVDSATGTARQIPWTEGMKLYAATKTGEANAALKAIQVLRGNQVITATDTGKLTARAPGPALLPGDIIRLGNLAAR